MKHENITLSIPSDLNTLLHVRVSRRGISKYVAEAVRKALDEDERKEQLKLEAAYEQANMDHERLQEIKDWSLLDKADRDDEWEWKDG
jgi:Arc/MetJ-type ribon-helix-helix transcriptional regulator